MPALIPDETLKQLRMNERDARVEIACRLYDANKLDMWPAAQLAGLSRDEFQAELLQRNLPLFHWDEEYVRQELATAGIRLKAEGE